MKVRVSFELDLSNLTCNAKDVTVIPFCVEQLGDFVLGLLHQANQRKERWLAATTEVNLEIERDLILASQLFNCFKVSGVTDDGHTFEFTHLEPGYKEQTIVDGVKQ